MGSEIKVATIGFNYPTSIGTFDVQVPNLGWTPKACKVITAGSITHETSSIVIRSSMGYSDGASEYGVSSWANNGSNPSLAHRKQSNSRISELINSTVVEDWFEAVGNGAGPIQNGWRFYCGDASSSAKKCYVVFYGGKDLKAKTVEHTLPIIGAQAKTGLGFTPNYIEAINGGLGNTTLSGGIYISFGAAYDGASIEQGVIYSQPTTHNASPTSSSLLVRDDAITGQITGGASIYAVSLQSFDADGYTVNVDSGSTGSDIAYFLCLDIGDRKASVSLITSPNTLNEDWLVTSPGFKPQYAEVSQSMIETADINTVLTDQKAGYIGFGLSDGSTNFSWSATLEDNVVSSNVARVSADKFAYLLDTTDAELFDIGLPEFNALGWIVQKDRLFTVDSTQRRWLSVSIEAEDVVEPKGNIFIPRKDIYTRDKPIGQVSLNVNNSFTEDLFRAFYVQNGVIHNLLTDEFISIGDNGTSLVDDRVFNNSDSRKLIGQLYPEHFGLSSICSHKLIGGGSVVWYDCDDLNFVGARYNGFGDALGREIHYSSSSVFCTLGDTTTSGQRTVAGPTSVVGQEYFMGFTMTEARRIEFFIDGVYHGTSDQADNSTPQLSDGGLLNNVGEVARTDRYLRGSTGFFFSWSHEKSRDSLSELTSNPYQLVTERRKYWQLGALETPSLGMKVPKKLDSLKIPQYSEPVSNLWMLGDNGLDLVGTDNLLTEPTEELRRLNGINSKYFENEAKDHTRTSTNIIATEDFFHAWFLFYPEEGYDIKLFGRGQDGFGSGWSVAFQNVGTKLKAFIVTTSDTNIQWSAQSLGDIKVGEWNFGAMSVLQANGVEPSFIKVHLNGESVRTGLTGDHSLRTSTVLEEIGSTKGNTEKSNKVHIALGGLRIVANTMTEDESDRIMDSTYHETMEAISPVSKFIPVKEPVKSDLGILIIDWERFKETKPAPDILYELDQDHEFYQDLEGFDFRYALSTIQINPNSVAAGNRIRINGTMLSPVHYVGGSHVSWTYLLSVQKDGEVWSSDLEHIVISATTTVNQRIRMYRHNTAAIGNAMASLPSTGSLVETAMTWSDSAATIYEDGTSTGVDVRGTLPFNDGVNRRLNVGNSTMGVLTDWAYFYSVQLSKEQRDEVFARPYDIIKKRRKYWILSDHVSTVVGSPLQTNLRRYLRYLLTR